MLLHTKPPGCGVAAADLHHREDRIHCQVLELANANRLGRRRGATDAHETDDPILVALEDHVNEADGLFRDEELARVRHAHGLALHQDDVGPGKARALFPGVIHDHHGADEQAVVIDAALTERDAERRLLEDLGRPVRIALGGDAVEGVDGQAVFRLRVFDRDVCPIRTFFNDRDPTLTKRKLFHDSPRRT